MDPQVNDDEITKADLNDAEDGGEAEKPGKGKAKAKAKLDPKSLEAENERLKAELASLKSSTPANLAGGKFTCSIKDGPTLTVEARPGERPEDAFMRVAGIHSTPHKIEFEEVHPDHPVGLHLPNGKVKSLTGVDLYQPIVSPKA